MKFDYAEAPTYRELRPYKDERTATFPVYSDPDLSQRLRDADAYPDTDIAFAMVVCSAYAYGEASTAAMMAARLGLEGNRCWTVSEYVDALFSTSTAQVIQSADGSVVIVAYRGTPPTNVITWLTDFQVDPVRIQMRFASQSDRYYDVHAGFYRNVRSTRPTIIDALRRAIAGQSVKPGGGAVGHGLRALYITGHSLGGASAAMFAAMLVSEPAYEPIVERLRAVYTYGAPMIGSPDFADACERESLLRERVIRYIYDSDIVPQVPPAESGPFKHFGLEYQYRLSGDSGEWQRNEAPRAQLHNLAALVTAPLTVIAKAFTATRHIRFHASLNDHLPEYYVAALTPKHVESEFGS